MDRETIEAFEKAHQYILPESYINFLLICDNHPEKYCKGYRDIILYSLEELPQERKLYEMDEYCPEYIAIGYGGGGEILIMKQEMDTDTLIISSGGALLTKFISPEHCPFFYDFFAEWVLRGCPANEINPMYG